MSVLSFLDREQTVAGPGYNRWLFPPAALAVHMCIGQAYSLSVFNIPVSRLIGITQSAPGDWSLSATVWVFNIAFFFLGISAAIFGKWVERSGPRKTMLCSALFFASGFAVSSLGIHLHSLPVFIGGYGVLGGIGLGLGYISPVSTLIKWFPDRPGYGAGHHGLWWRRADWVAAGRDADEALRHPHLAGRVGNADDHGRDLFMLHDLWVDHRPRTRSQLETCGLDTRCQKR